MKPYWKVTLWYVGFGILWIFLSDKAIEAFSPNTQILTFLQTVKGWFYVLISGLLIFYLTKKAFDEHLTKDREKFSVFRKTIEGVHHILLNYLNQMQLVTMEAERSKDFDKEIITLSKDLSEKATEELMKLNEIDPITSDHIDSVVYRDLKKQ